MRSRTLGILSGVLAAFVLQVACTAMEPPPPPPAATQPAPAPPPPPPPATQPGPACLTNAILTYDPANAATPLSLDQKPITVQYPASSPAAWGICWTLVVKGGDPDPFDQIRLDGVGDVTGQGGRPVLYGDTNFKGRTGVWVQFNDEPKWGGKSSVTVTYDVVARLKGSTSQLAVDPDIVIQKPGG